MSGTLAIEESLQDCLTPSQQLTADSIQPARGAVHHAATADIFHCVRQEAEDLIALIVEALTVGVYPLLAPPTLHHLPAHKAYVNTHTHTHTNLKNIHEKYNNHPMTDKLLILWTML